MYILSMCKKQADETAGRQQNLNVLKTSRDPAKVAR